MENNNFISFKYVVGNDFVYEDKVVVKVFFVYDYKNVTKVLNLKKKNNANESYYIDEAKKIINAELKNGELLKYTKRYIAKNNKSRAFKIALASILSLGVIGSASYGTYRLVDDIQTRQSIIRGVADLILSLDENSTYEEIAEAYTAYENLSDSLKKSVPQETKNYLDLQIELYRTDKVAADAVNELTASFTIEATTEPEVTEAEEKINALTKRGNTLLRTGTKKLIKDIKDAIALDKMKAKALDNRIAEITTDTTVDVVYQIVLDALDLSPRAYSYISDESIATMEYVIDVLDSEYTVAQAIATRASEYSQETATCTLAEINVLQNIYDNWLYVSGQQMADYYNFSTNIQTARDLWTRDDNNSTTLANLAKQINIETCLSADIEAVTTKYTELATNQRTQDLARNKGYDEAIANAQEAYDTDVNKTKTFYTKEMAIIDPNCSQDDIYTVQADLDTYLVSASGRLKTLITTDECGYNLQSQLKTAQESYNADLAEAKRLYDLWCAKLTPSSTREDIDWASDQFHDYMQNPNKARIKGFLSTGGIYDMKAKIDEAEALYKQDEAAADKFHLAVARLGLVDPYTSLTTEQKMLMVSANEYLNHASDKRHSYLNARAKSFIQEDKKQRLAQLMSQAGNKIKLTLEPIFNEDKYIYFSSDNVIKFDSEAGLYVDVTLTTHEGRFYNPRLTKVMGSATTSDYPRVFDPSKYNHVICRVCVPEGVNNKLKIEGVRYIGDSGADDPFITKNPELNKFVTVDVPIDEEYEYVHGTYNGFTIGIKGQKEQDVGKVFKVTGHYSENREE